MYPNNVLNLYVFAYKISLIVGPFPELLS